MKMLRPWRGEETLSGLGLKLRLSSLCLATPHPDDQSDNMKRLRAHRKEYLPSQLSDTWKEGCS
jgi:hypothetical protein